MEEESEWEWNERMSTNRLFFLTVLLSKNIIGGEAKIPSY